MSTVIRPEISKKKEYWISKERYYELLHFCRQYKEWKQLYFETINGLSNTEGIFEKSQIEWSNPTAIKVEIAERYFNNYSIIESAAKETDPVMWKYILLAATEGASYVNLKTKMGIPCGKDLFYKLYRKFFYILSMKRL